MTAEDEEFNRIEREASLRKAAGDDWFYGMEERT
jgi:hypothetical protein